MLSLSEQTLARRTTEPSLTLLQAISGTSDVERRKTIIKRYWIAAIANMDLTLALEEHAELNNLANPSTRVQQVQLSGAKAAARAQVQEAELAFRMTQFDLIEAMGRGEASQPPWPVDTPFIGKYRTNFEKYAAVRGLPGGIERIHYSLPLVLDVVESRAESITEATNVWSTTAADYRSGRTPAYDLIQATKDRRDQRLAWLASLRDYNALICDYALTVAPAGLPAESVVPMLIKQEESMLARDNGIRRASFEQPVRTAPASNLDSTWHSLTPR